MISVGVRELRQRASELLRLVQAGETIEVTDRGRPVALLAPLPDAGPLQRLRASGELIVTRGDLDDLPEPLLSRNRKHRRACLPASVAMSADRVTYLDSGDREARRP